MSEQLTKNEIESRIFEFRSLQVMIDRDLAEMYQVETKVLNQAVKRNSDRFPDYYRFQLTNTEKNELVTNCDRFENLKHSSSNPYVFTEQGVAMLSAVLRSDIAVKVSARTINQSWGAFVKNVVWTLILIIPRLVDCEVQLKPDYETPRAYL